MNRNRSLVRKRRKESGINIWSIVGGAAFVLVAAVVVVSIPDIKRYIKISTM
jgi:hypothetical protein